MQNTILKYFNADLTQVAPQIKNIGWTLGNDCPYKCKHCYSLMVRKSGAEITKQIVSRIANQLAMNNVETVNLGGNEPMFTNGPKVENSILPFIIDVLNDRGLITGLTTASITLEILRDKFPEHFKKLNDVDISIDSPFKYEHDENRGAKLFDKAINAAHSCNDHGIEHTLVMCGMSWNLSEQHLKEFVRLAKITGSNIRINFLKPTEPKHIQMMPTADQYYFAFKYLMEHCDPIDLGEALLSTLVHDQEKGCPCGVKSFRIHSITPNGKIPVSPCVYMHDYVAGNLVTDNLADIIKSPQFQLFRQRIANPAQIESCDGCTHLQTCRGGCSARAYLSTEPSQRNGLLQPDPYCLRTYNKSLKMPKRNLVKTPNQTLVHEDYLCTIILNTK